MDYKKVIDIPAIDNEEQQIHTMCTVNNHVFVSDGLSVYSFYVPPKTVWTHIKDLFFTGKSWLN